MSDKVTMMEEQNGVNELEAALGRVMVQEEMEFTILLNHIQELKNQMIELKSKSNYAGKEADAVYDGKETSSMPLAEQKMQINTEILELNNTKVNHVLVRDTLQKAAFNVQMQEAVHESLQDLDEKVVESSTEVQMLLEHHGSNLHISKDLLGAIQEKEQLDREILQTRMKYLAHMKIIKEKWEVLEGKTNTSLGIEDEEVAQFRSKVESRENKLKLVIHMLQGLISASGIVWGGDDYYVQVMLLCDFVLGEGSKADMENLLNGIEKAREGREKQLYSKPKTSVEPKSVKYFTSTPFTKSVRL